jgi:hypothetical protein
MVFRWTHKGLEHEGNSAVQDSDDDDESCTDSAELTGSNTQKVPDLDDVIDMWQRCSILVGMHPDQVLA